MSADARPEPATPWVLRDYVSPGLAVIRPDAAFPHLRPGDALHHPWKYLRRDVPHTWYVDDRFPVMGVLSRDEAMLLHNIALRFAGARALEIGSWIGWSTAHLALAGVQLDAIDPAHDDPAFRAIVDASLTACGVADRVRLHGGRSPDGIAAAGGPWSLFFVDGDHEGAAPVRDVAACLAHATETCAVVLHDVASPAVAAAVRLLADRGFHVVLYQTAQMMAMAWRGDVAPVPHVADPEVVWQVPAHLIDLPIGGRVVTPSRMVHPTLAERLAALGDARRAPEPQLRPSVCIVTSELVGPFKNGGIGTAMTGLAETLADAGLAVTVLYTGGIWSPGVSLAGWREHYAGLGITFETLDLSAFATIAGPLKDRGFGVPWFVLRWLEAHPFDIVHFNDCAGEGSLCLAAKRLGIGFQASLLTVALHSPSRWVLDLNQAPPTSLALAAFNHAEHVSLACADLLWSPSRYLLDWAAAHDFTLPRQTVVQQYAIPSPRVGQGAQDTAPAPAPSATPGALAPVRDIVFFGRLEERKGLRRFCAAVHLLRDEIAAAGASVTFLGKPERCGGLPSLEYIARRSATWTFPVHTVTDLGQPEALRRLAEPGAVAVMASPVDNSPCTVYEALDRGIPFLAARTGGIPELVAAEDRARVLFEPTVDGLRAALAATLAHGAGTARPAVPQADTKQTWLALHARWREFLPAPEAVDRPVRSVAVVVDHRSGDRLDRTLAAIPQCPAINRVVIVNHDGDALPLDSLDLTVSDPDVVAHALADAPEDAVLLIHSGAAIDAGAFADMLAALGRSAVDGLQPAGRVEGPAAVAIPPLGVSATVSLFDGPSYPGALLVRRDALQAATAGRAPVADSPFVGLADACASHGRRIWPYPREVVTLLPQHRPAAGAATAGRLALYAGAEGHDRYYMLGVGHAAVSQPAPIVTRMQLATAAAGLGLSPLVRVGAWGLRRVRRWVGR